MPKTPSVRSNVKDGVKKVGKATVQEPFSLPGDQIQKKSHEKFLKQVEEQQEAEKQAREFKANPVPSFYPKTYAQQHQEDESTDENLDAGVTDNIRDHSLQLASERRAKERALYEEYKRKKEEQMRLLKQLEQDEKKRQEQAEIEQIRRATQYKAKPFVLKKDEFPKIQPRPVTKAVTPGVLKRTFQLFTGKK